MEYRFLTASVGGDLLSTNGQFIKDLMLDDYCHTGGWEIEHAELEKSSQEVLALWRLIVSRPRHPKAAYVPETTNEYTTSQHPLAAAVGGGE